MTERCSVTKVKRGLAYVAINKSQKCDGCKMCAFGKNDVIIMPALCDIPVKAGQSVTVRMPTKPVGNAVLAVYALPLLAMVIGALIGLAGDWRLQLGLAAAGLIVGFAAVIPIERMYRKRSGALPVVISADSADEQKDRDGSVVQDSHTDEINTDNGEQYGT